jgi:predicted site-specific integrase-resolvase
METPEKYQFVHEQAKSSIKKYHRKKSAYFKKAAKVLRVSVRSVYRWFATGLMTTSELVEALSDCGEGVVKVSEVMDTLGWSESKVYRMIYSGKLDTVILPSGTIRIKKSTVEWLA